MKFSKGFTLIEVIVTIVIMAIAATVFMTYFGSTFTGSAKQAGLVQKQYVLIQEMEEITSDYRREITNNPSSFTLAAFKSDYVDTMSNVDNTKTGLIQLPNTSGSYITQTVLRVTLVNGDQTLMSIFTQ